MYVKKETSGDFEKQDGKEEGGNVLGNKSGQGTLENLWEEDGELTEAAYQFWVETMNMYPEYRGLTVSVVITQCYRDMGAGPRARAYVIQIIR